MANRFTINVADGGMEATLSITAGESCTTADLRKAISDAGVRRGVLEEPVEQLGQKLADTSFTVNKKVIAQGKRMTEGKAGKLHINNANAKKDIPASHLADDSAKTTGKGGGDKSYLISVVKGQELGHVDRATPGEAGWTVKDAILDCPRVDDPILRLGIGLKCNSKNLVCATSTGVLFNQDGDKLSVVPVPANKRILITVSNDLLKATVRLFPGEPGDADTVTDAIEKAEITHGVDKKASTELAQKLRDPVSQIDELLIAEGVSAKKGKDGHFEPDFPVSTLAGKLRPDGTIDFRDRSTLIAVTDQEVIGLYHPPSNGTPGHDVKGGETEVTPGKDNPPKLGDGAAMGDGNTVVATIDGVINYQPGGTLQVNDAYEHRGDVDLKSGDLKMNGVIIVTGDVARDAKVQATDGIVIKGMIDAGGVECDGPVTVAGGVMVDGKAYIRAGGDVTCHHTQGARIECKETITVKQDIVTSFLRAKVITGESEKCRVRGGMLSAEEQIVVGEAGSELGVKTVLSVAMPLGWEYESVADKLGKAAGAPKPAPVKGKKRGPKKGKREKVESASAIMRRLNEVARIEVRGTLHPGVVIEIGPLSKIIERKSERVRFRYSVVDDEPTIVMQDLPRGGGG